MNKLGVFAIAFFGMLLAGCENPHQPLQARANEVFDMGVLPMPGSPNRLHGYRVVNTSEKDHFVYVIESPAGGLSGTSTSYTVPSGKSSHQQTVTSVIATSAETSAKSVTNSAESVGVTGKNAISTSAEPPSTQMLRGADGTVTLQVLCRSEAECAKVLSQVYRSQ